ncbi:GNAT family N-acetyltransferase [Citromicrobium bathyomarinum]|uniref:GNAT family N-acetyltransferase n=1 Tax=Citromicrobium bathyomarinum TaxID=72174 RepID=UPI00315A6AD2
MTGPDEAGWNIRLARPDDAPAMPAIERAAGAMFDRIEGLAGIAGQQTVPVDRLRRYIARGHCLVATSGETLVGFLVTQPFGRELHVYEFSVHPDWQGQGIGTALIRACLIDARNCGFIAVTLTTFDQVPWNAPFYRRMGFRDVDPTEHKRLALELENEHANGFPADSRVAMASNIS